LFIHALPVASPFEVDAYRGGSGNSRMEGQWNDGDSRWGHGPNTALTQWHFYIHKNCGDTSEASAAVEITPKRGVGRVRL